MSLASATTHCSGWRSIPLTCECNQNQSHIVVLSLVIFFAARYMVHWPIDKVPLTHQQPHQYNCFLPVPASLLFRTQWHIFRGISRKMAVVTTPPPAMCVPECLSVLVCVQAATTSSKHHQTTTPDFLPASLSITCIRHGTAPALRYTPG